MWAWKVDAPMVGIPRGRCLCNTKISAGNVGQLNTRSALGIGVLGLKMKIEGSSNEAKEVKKKGLLCIGRLCTRALTF